MSSTNQVNTVTTENVVPVGATYDANGNFITLVGAAGAPINTLSGGGTANGVAYLNGSKVLTTGSALTFDGTNLGLGVTPSAWSGTNGGAIQMGAGYTSLYSYSNAATLGSNVYYSSGANRYFASSVGVSAYQQLGGVHYWLQAASGTAGNAITFTQAMTLNASGNLLVGTTSGGQRLVVKGEAGNAAMNVLAANSSIGTYFSNGSGTASYDAAQFLTNGGGTAVGSITVSSSATAYVTSSDYRLKNAVVPMTGALAKVAALKPCTYKWNADGSDGEGFIAHELAEVCPHAVTGEKDAINKDGSIKSQGIDTSFLVATLTAAIQEQQALIQSLTDRVAQLEAK